MSRRRAVPDLANPIQLWSELAVKTTEMMFASAQVIAHRTHRIASLGPTPNARDQRELTRMGQEKIDALVESSQAMAAQWMRANTEFGTRLFTQMMSGAATLMSLTAGRPLSRTFSEQARIAHLINQSALSVAQLSEAAAHVAKRGLAPVHSRATANAKRLSRS